MPNYGIKVSKPGVNVGTAEGQSLVLFSTYNSPKILQEALGTQSYSGTAFSAVNIAHNLGYVPGFDMWVSPGTTAEWYTFSGGREVGSGTNITWYSEIDTANLSLFARVEGGGSVSLIYHYIVFVDPGA